MSDPAKDIPADRPIGWGDGRFRFRALGLGVPGTTRIGAMVELANQFHRPFEGMKVAISVVANVHHVPTMRAVAIKDIEFQQRKIRVRRPMIWHRADLRAQVDYPE